MRVYKVTDPIERFLVKIDFGTCWLWTGPRFVGTGYGAFGIKVGSVWKQRLAHRWSYEYFIGPIPSGLQIDHLCAVKRCVNPWHLEPVTARQNTLRCATAPGTINANKTTCPHGHSLADAYIWRGRRCCRSCSHQKCKRYYREVRKWKLQKSAAITQTPTL